MKNVIKRENEKATIIFMILKTPQLKHSMSPDNFISQWYDRWQYDFESDNEETKNYLCDLYKHYLEIYKNLSFKEIRDVRKGLVKNEIVTNSLNDYAYERDYLIQKGHSSKYGLNGLNLLKLKNKKLSGKNRPIQENFERVNAHEFELSYWDICEYFNISKDIGQQWIDEHLAEQTMSVAVTSKDITINRAEEKTAIIFYQIIRKDGNKKLTLKRYINDWRSHWSKDFQIFRNENNSFNDEAITNYFTQLFKKYYEKWGKLDRKAMMAIRSKFLTAEILPKSVHTTAKGHGVIVMKYKGACMGYSLGGFCIKDEDTKKVVAGQNFELTLDDVCEFLGIRVNKDAEYKYFAEKGKGYYNWRGIKARDKAKKKADRKKGNTPNLNNKKTSKPKKGEA